MDVPNTIVPSKFLLVRFSSIGDIVLTSPVVRILKHQINAEIHILTKEIYQDLWISNPYVSKIWCIKKDLKEISSDLKNEKYNGIIDLHANLRTFLLRLILWDIPFYSIKKGSFSRWIYVVSGLKPKNVKHIVTRYLETLHSFPVIYDGKGLDFFLPQMEAEKIDKPYIICVLGARHFTKRIPLEKWIEILDKFQSHRIILIGGKEEENIGKLLVEKSGENVMNYCGVLTLLASANWIKNAQLVITGDTGMMHIAAALKKPVLSIWGGTIPEFGWLPFYPEGMNRNITIQNDLLSCRPCSKFGRADCPQKHFRCMKDISATHVYEHGKILLQNKFS